jgi:hypothetical protein
LTSTSLLKIITELGREPASEAKHLKMNEVQEDQLRRELGL